MDLVDLDRGTCPCGHEVDPATGECIVWDGHGHEHRLASTRAGTCTCHGIPLLELDRREWWQQ